MRCFVFILALFVIFFLAACLPPAVGGLPPTTESGSLPVPTAQEIASPALPSGAQPGPRPGGVLRYGLTLPVSGIDPHIHASSELGIALSSVYDTLVVQDRDGQFHPHLARAWQISADGREYVFALRTDVTFHDGTPFNAQAVARNLERVADPATRSQKAVFLLGPFDHAEVLDDFTVKIVLKEPYAPLLDGLSQVYLGMASPAALDRWDDEYQFHQVGSGPFRFVGYSERQMLVLERNPDYRWAPEIRAHQGPAYLERIEFRFYPDPATRLPALLSGQADVMGELPPTDAETLAHQHTQFTLYPVAVPGQSVQFFLNTTLPPLTDVRVRRALLYATDREALVRAVFGSWSPVAWGPLSAVTRGFDRFLVGSYPYQPEQARTLLADAGWSDTDGDGLLDRDGQPLVLRGVLMAWGELSKIGTILQAQWREVGIDLQLELLAYPAALEAGRQGTHHLIPFVFSGTDPNMLRTFFHSANVGGFNWARASDPEVDSWLDQAAELSDWLARAKLYAQVQQRVMEQAWTLPIRDQVNLNVAAARVQGLTFDVQGWFPVLYDVWLSQ